MYELLILLWIGSEVVLVITRRSRGDEPIRADRASLRLLWSTICLSIIGGILCALFQVAPIHNHRALLYCSGELVIVAGLAIRWVAILTLGHAFRVDVAVAHGQQLVDKGIYRIVRHPSYTGCLVSFLGLGMTYLDIVSVLVVTMPIAAAFLYRIHVEEAAMRAAMSSEYAQYAARTKRLVPFLY